MRAAVYLRQSIDATGEGLAVDRQRTDCLRLCQAKGWTPAEYVDNHVSASTGTRPAYERLLADIQAGSVDAVVVWDLDRLHRRPIELERFMQLADQHQIALATVTGDVDLGTDNGRLFARIKAAVARAEVERKSARQQAANRQRVATGKPWASVRPYGYRDNLMTLEPAEAELLRGCYRDIRAGVSLTEVTRRLNAAGGRTTRGNRWQRPTLKQTMIRPRYAGLVEHHGKIAGPGQWPALIPEDEWRIAVDRLTSHQPLGRRPKGLLSSLAVCGVCGHVVGRINVNAKVAYACALIDADGHAKKHVTRRADLADERVITAILERLGRPDARDLLTVRDDDTPALSAEAHDLRERLKVIAADFAAGDLTPAEWKASRDAVKQRLAAVESRMVDHSTTPLLGPLVHATDRRTVWDGMGLDRQRATIDLLATVTIDRTPLGPVFRPEHVRVEWKL